MPVAASLVALRVPNVPANDGLQSNKPSPSETTAWRSIVVNVPKRSICPRTIYGNRKSQICRKSGEISITEFVSDFFPTSHAGSLARRRENFAQESPLLGRRALP